MPHRQLLAIVGSGPSCIYLLKHLLDGVALFREHLAAIGIFEKSGSAGMGMPYNPETTDRLNMSNISSEELPNLTITFADWLREQDSQRLEEFGIAPGGISESEVYSRLALGQYLQSQYQAIIAELEAAGIPVRDHSSCKIVDLREEQGRVSLFEDKEERFVFDRAVIATGHYWPEDDRPDSGYFASPWPIAKLLPASGQRYNFTIGTLGASLSAFDVVSSLAHRHGTFEKKGGGLVFRPHAGAEKFRIAMHTADGMLPHLQYAQEEPMREIERHISKKELLSLRDKHGFLRLATYFNCVCRRVLVEALHKDGEPELAALLEDAKFNLESFVETMTETHRYADAFEGMRTEMKEAEKSLTEHQPIHWKEAIDDLTYTLSFHAELLPAEDQLTLHSKWLPFVMNVIAAVPLPTAHRLLALRDADALEIVTGRAEVVDSATEADSTTVQVNNEGTETKVTYRMFVDCSGQGSLKLEDFPFPSLAGDGVREARAAFCDPDAAGALKEVKRAKVFTEDGRPYYPIGGIEIDRGYCLIGRDGHASSRVHDIAFPHISGLRPFSYGLQACDVTARLLVAAWTAEFSRQR